MSKTNFNRVRVILTAVILLMMPALMSAQSANGSYQIQGQIVSSETGKVDDKLDSAIGFD